MIAQSRGATILKILKDTVALPRLMKPNVDAFETLVETIISQNTADTNTERAFKELSKHLEITPQTLAKAKLGEIEDCLHIAGLYQSKAKAIHTASKIIIEKFGGSLTPVLSLPLDEARKKLMDLPGVGPKTADVVLLFSAHQPTIPVDTHVNRVSKRLGLAPADGNYEEVRLSLQSLFESKDYLVVHLLLIGHGRKTCKSQRPRCHECPVYDYCPSNNLEDQHD
ncbi:MAG: endonuclease III domain-containing protein [Candidatus Bathyarchaeia archaeon]